MPTIMNASTSKNASTAAKPADADRKRVRAICASVCLRRERERLTPAGIEGTLSGCMVYMLKDSWQACLCSSCVCTEHAADGALPIYRRRRRHVNRQLLRSSWLC